MESFYELEYEENSEIGNNVDADLQLLLGVCKEKLANFDEKLITKAFYYCVEKHSNVIRKSGKPYYSHPLNVALIILNDFPICDNQSVVACLLHDTIEDVEGVKKSSIEEEFTKEIAEMVDAVTKISHEETSKLTNKANTYRKLFLALVKDVRVILIKLADRLHNIRTLHYLQPYKQKSIALETLNFYIPLAHRLGLNKIKMELENLSFFFSDREAYETIRSSLNEKRRDFIRYIASFTSTIQNSLDSHSINHTLTVVHKQEYEIFGMLQDGKTISDIDNFYSVVIILKTNEISECYRAHGVLATAFHSINFMDFIVHSKLDWYKSLYSELFGPDGKRIEILIRTEEMERIAEEGFNSIFSLKDGRTRALEISDEDIEAWGQWMQDIISSNEENAAQIIWDAIKVNLFDSELTVFSKEGTPTKLPKSASVLDYAFSINNQTGFSCISAKINGIVRDIAYTLQNGDQIELMLSDNISPKMDWLQYVSSHKAVVALHKYFKENPIIQVKKLEEKENFDIRIKIIGEDKEGMLQKITVAMGQNNMKRINLETQGTQFEGIILINVKNNKELNLLFAKLMQIKGIRHVEKMDEV